MAIYELCGFAKRNKVKVLISGDGADEYLEDIDGAINIIKLIKFF